MNKIIIRDKDDLSLIYSPGMKYVSNEIIAVPSREYELGIRKNTVAIISDGSAVMPPGKISTDATLQIIEEKAIQFKEFAGIDAFPICLATQNVGEIIQIVKNILPVFSGINIEDITAPRSFEIQQSLANVGVPVFQDDHQGTAIVLLAALINGTILAGKNLNDLTIVVNGAGMDSFIFVQLLLESVNNVNPGSTIREILVCDKGGILSRAGESLGEHSVPKLIAMITNQAGQQGTLKDALKRADVYIDFSEQLAIREEDVKAMNNKPIIFDLTHNPSPVSPELIRRSGAFIVGTDRKDSSNYLKPELVFPGIFRGALDAGAHSITGKMAAAAAFALADSVEGISIERILPGDITKSSAETIASRVRQAFEEELKINLDENGQK